MALIILAEEKLAQVRAFADSIGMRDNLEDAILRADRQGDYPVRTKIYGDLYENSLGFTKEYEAEPGVWKHSITGGINYSKGYGWSVNT